MDSLLFHEPLTAISYPKTLPNMTTKCHIVMYHYVRPIERSRYPRLKGLEVSLFVQQLDYLERHFNIIRIEDLIDCVEHSTQLPKKSLILTFDDGYAEHFSTVYPILKQRGLQGTFYTPVKAITDDHVMDVNKLHFILTSCQDVRPIVRYLESRLGELSALCGLDDFSTYYKQWAVANRFDSKEIIFIKRLLQHVLPLPVRHILVDELFKDYVDVDEAVLSQELYMQDYQLAQLVADGMHIGNHGYDHLWWNTLDSDALNTEIDSSLQFMESMGCDMNRWTACYPYGSHDKQVMQALANRHCRLAVTTEVRCADLAEDHPLLLPRYDTNDFPPVSHRFEQSENQY